MAARWDGKVGKIPKIGDKRETKRFSPKVQQGEPEFHECRTVDEEREEDSGRGNPREPGAAQLYTPETVSQYKSQWTRYQRALSLTPAGIKQEGKKWIYKFASCNSLTGFWEVTVDPGATYLNIKKPIWQILCPKPIDFDVVDSDGDSFTWTQTRGKRTATLNGIVLSREASTPFDTSVPELDILTLCLNNGCADNSVDPIVLNVQPEGQPELFDSVTIYTTPTSFYDGLSCAVEKTVMDGGACRQVPCQVYPSFFDPPQYLQRSYIFTGSGYTVTWSLPTCDAEYLVETIWQQNTTGQYLDVQRFPVNSNRIFTALLNTHYRIRSVFNVRGHQTTSDGCRFYFQNRNQLIIADDNLNGISYSVRTKKSVLPLDRRTYSFDETYSGISYSARTTKNVLPLDRQTYSFDETYNGISYAATFKIQKINLGGMIIT